MASLTVGLQMPDLKSQVTDLKAEVPDLRSGWIRLNLNTEMRALREEYSAKRLSSRLILLISR